MPTAGTTHHVVLNGVGYMLRNGRDGLAFKRSEVSYFVPRRTDNVGREALTRPGQDNGGFASGVVDTFGEGGYGRVSGIDARAGDGLRIATQLLTTSGLTVQVYDFTEFDGDVYAATNSGSATRVWKISGTTWSEIAGLVAGAAVLRFMIFAPHLWCVGPSIAPFIIDTLDTPAATGGANTTDLDWVGRAGTWAVGMAEGGDASRLRWVATATGVNTTTAWNTIAENGDNWAEVLGIEALGDRLYIAKTDGLYQATHNSTTSATLEKVVDHFAEFDSGNFGCLTAWRDHLYYNIRDRLYRFNGSSEEDVSPPLTVVGTTDGLLVLRYRVRSLAAANNWLWALTDNDNSVKQVHLWAYNGERWEMVHQLAQHASSDCGALHYSPSDDRLYISYNDGSAWAVARMAVRSTSDLPSGDFATTGNYVYLPPVDGGLPDVSKLFHSVAIRASNLSSTSSVYCSYWNGAAWTSLGSLTQDPGGELLFPANVKGNYVLLRLELRSGGVVCGVIREVGVTYDVLPGPQKTVEMELLLGPNLKGLDGAVESNSPTVLLAALDTARAAGTVVALSDPVVSATGGSAINVRLTQVEVEGIRYVPDSNGQYGWLAKVKAEVVT